MSHCMNAATGCMLSGVGHVRCACACDVCTQRVRPVTSPAVEQQPTPARNEHPAVWDLVAADMAARDRFGASKYSTRLKPHNGRDYLTDAYQEALDLSVYLRGLLFERDGN